MLTRLAIKRFKSLYDVSLELEPLTVFIGPNGSGKSNICDSLVLLSNYPQLSSAFKGHSFIDQGVEVGLRSEQVSNILKSLGVAQSATSIFWRGDLSVRTIDFELNSLIEVVKSFNFVPSAISKASNQELQSSGEGIANSLARVLFDNREMFNELESRFIQLVPNISRISLDQNQNRQNILRLVDRHSDYKIPASDVSDGTLRLLAFLTALYDIDSPDIICFEEPENGVHPWLLNKIMELLNQVSQEGIRGRPVQILVTTHSPVLLNYVEPEQIRAVELDEEGKTQIRSLPTDSVRFQKAMEAYDGELGELWFTNLFGGNPE